MTQNLSPLETLKLDLEVSQLKHKELIISINKLEIFHTLNKHCTNCSKLIPSTQQCIVHGIKINAPTKNICVLHSTKRAWCK